jgi:hypothetical protein
MGRALLPWICALSLAGAAIAVMNSANRPAPANSQAPAPVPVSVPVPPAPAAASTPPISAPAALHAPPPSAAPEPAAASEPPADAPAQGAQIWECTTNGQRTFSDKPCGDKPKLREVSALNVMSSTPMGPHVRSYQSEQGYVPEYYPPSEQEAVDAAFPVVVGYPVLGYPYQNRRRPDHAHRPHPQPHGSTPRKTQ